MTFKRYRRDLEGTVRRYSIYLTRVLKRENWGEAIFEKKNSYKFSKTNK